MEGPEDAYGARPKGPVVAWALGGPGEVRCTELS